MTENKTSEEAKLSGGRQRETTSYTAHSLVIGLVPLDLPMFQIIHILTEKEKILDMFTRNAR